MDLSKSRILLVNDDGITAPGLKLLHRVARSLSKDVWIFAPETEQSGASHSFTLTSTIRVQKLGARRFSVSGSPTDCVLMAMCEFLKDHPPDLVLSGINRGANLAEEVTYSGTVAGAMEAALFGVPAIALSQATLADRTIHWYAAEHHAESVIRKLVSVEWTRDVFMNVNFPACHAEDVRGVRVVKQGRRSAAYEIVKVPRLRGRDFYLIGESQRGTEMQTGDSDHKVVDRNMIAVTPLHVDLTHRGSLTTIRSLFAKR
jgi:5'-nucleotidase